MNLSGSFVQILQIYSYGVSPSLVVKVVQRLEKSGSAAAAKQGRASGKGRLAIFKTALVAQVGAHPDLTLVELRDWLARKHRVGVHLFSISRTGFEAYVKTRLAPALNHGDVVILDNLSSHKSAKAATILRKCGAWFLFLPPILPI